MNNHRDIIQQYLRSLNDEQLLYLYGIYVGEVPAPFHKPNLIMELSRLLLNPDTAASQVSLLDAADLDIIITLMHAKHRDIQSLVQVLSSKGYGEHQVRRTLFHLEERMVLFPFSSPRGISYSISPPVADRLSSAVSLESLFPLVRKDNDTPMFPLTPSVFFSWISLLRHRSELFTPNGKVNSRKTADFCSLFPALDSDSALHCASILQEGAKSLGIITQHNAPPNIDEQALNDISARNPESLILWTVLSPMVETELVENLAGLIGFIADRWVLQSHMTGLLCLLLGVSLDQADELQRTLADSGTGAIQDGYFTFFPLIRTLSFLKSPSLIPRILLSADLRLHIEDHELCSCWHILTRFCILEQYDRMLIVRMTRESVLYALDTGLGIKEILGILEELTRCALPETVKRILEDWVSAYRNIAVYHAMVLQCDPRISGIIKGHPKLKELMYKEITPGVFLYAPSSHSEVSAYLKESGLPYVPSAQKIGYTRKYQRIRITDLPSVTASENHGTALSWDSKVVLDHLMGELESMSVSPDVRSELLYRINQRLVLSVSQLQEASRKRTIFEAGGFDYQGKLQLIRQAVSSRSDILELNIQGRKQPVMVMPENLFREGTSDILTGRTIPHGEEFTISAGKILLVRKIRKPLCLAKRDMLDR